MYPACPSPVYLYEKLRIYKFELYTAIFATGQRISVSS